MTTRTSATQLTLDGERVLRTRFKFAPGEYDKLRTIAEEHRVECEYHYSHLNPPIPAVLYLRPDRHYPLGPPIFKYQYYSPWQKDGEVPEYCDTVCRWCEEYGLVRESDFGPEYCERCERDVIQRCPQNGWRSYFASDPEYPEELCCVGCSQRFYLEHGIPRERFEGDSPVSCDFFNISEVEAAGFSEWGTRYGRDIVRDPDAFRHEMLDLIDAGSVVLLDQGATGIGNGYPDWVTIYAKGDTADN